MAGVETASSQQNQRAIGFEIGYDKVGIKECQWNNVESPSTNDTQENVIGNRI